jgi:hypothetical protein
MRLNMTIIGWETVLLSILAHRVNVILFRIKAEENVKKNKTQKKRKDRKSINDHRQNTGRREN